MLNWIYVDEATHALRYGGRKDTVGHVIGPWGWSDDELFLTLRGDKDPFVAKQEEGGRWSVYWDPEEEMEDTRPLRLRRRMLCGIESRYVRDSDEAKN
jgi:hypothetical protein